MTKKDFRMIALNLRNVCARIKTRSEQRVFDSSVIQIAKSFQSIYPRSRFDKYDFAKIVYSFCPEENPFEQVNEKGFCFGSDFE